MPIFATYQSIFGHFNSKMKGLGYHRQQYEAADVVLTSVRGDRHGMYLIHLLVHSCIGFMAGKAKRRAERAQQSVLLTSPPG